MRVRCEPADVLSKSFLKNWIAINIFGSIGCGQFSPKQFKTKGRRNCFLHNFAVFSIIFALALVVPSLSAHEARPAYLEIKETAPNQFSVLWRTPVLAGMRLPVILQLPVDLKNQREPDVQELADSYLERRRIDAGPSGLAGKRIEFPGLQLTITDVLVRVELLDGRKFTTICSSIAAVDRGRRRAIDVGRDGHLHRSGYPPHPVRRRPYALCSGPAAHR